MFCLVSNDRLAEVLAENDVRRAVHLGEEITAQINLLYGSLQKWTVVSLTSHSDGLRVVMSAEQWVDRLRSGASTRAMLSARSKREDV